MVEMQKYMPFIPSLKAAAKYMIDQEETDTGGKKTNLPPCMLPTGKIYHHGTLFSLSGLDTFFFMDVVAELSIKVTILPAKNV